MNFFDHSYYTTSKNSACLIGRWPYQRRLESRICSFIIVFFGISQFLGQILGLIKYIDDSAIVLELLMPCILYIAMAIKYVNMYVNVGKIVKLLDQLKENWNIYTEKEEKRILNEYAHMGKVVINGYTVLVYVAIAIFVIEPSVPKLRNYFFELNQTIANRYPIPIHFYIIDVEKNFYPILCFQVISVVTTLTITVANDSMFIFFLQHACGLFAVVGHQLENLPEKGKLKEESCYDVKSSDINDIEYSYYVSCIKNHKRAIEFADLLEKVYVWCFCGIITLNMPAISVLAVQLVTQANTIPDTIKFCMNISMFTFHLFFDCYLAQQLTDYSTAIQQHITDSNWYGMSIRTRKLVTMVTLRSQVPCILTAGKLVTLSMRSFGVIIKTSISYFTVMLSTR